jgi:hypothetical protein
MAGTAHALESFVNAQDCYRERDALSQRHQAINRQFGQANARHAVMSNAAYLAYAPTVAALSQAAEEANRDLLRVWGLCNDMAKREEQARREQRQAEGSAQAQQATALAAAEKAKAQADGAKVAAKLAATAVGQPSLAAAELAKRGLDKQTNALLEAARAGTPGAKHPSYEKAVDGVREALRRTSPSSGVQAIQSAALDEIKRQHLKVLDDLQTATSQLRNFKAEAAPAVVPTQAGPSAAMPWNAAPQAAANPWREGVAGPAAAAAAGPSTSANPWAGEQPSRAAGNGRANQVVDPWQAEQAHIAALRRRKAAQTQLPTEPGEPGEPGGAPVPAEAVKIVRGNLCDPGVAAEHGVQMPGGCPLAIENSSERARTGRREATSK